MTHEGYTVEAADVRIEFAVKWRDAAKNLCGGYAWTRFSVEAKNLDEPLRQQVQALADEAARQVHEREEAKK